MRRRFVLLCGTTLFQFVALGLLLASLPLYLTRELGASRAVVGLAVGSYSASAVLWRPFIGTRLDRSGRRLFLAGAPLLLGAATAGLFVARSVVVVVLLRLVQGIAGATFYTAAATVATDLAPPERRGEYISRFSLFLYGGFAIGPTVATAVIAWGGFAWTWTVGIACVVLSSAIAFALPETRPASEPDAPIPRFRMVHPAAVGPGMVLITAAVGYTAISVFAPLYAERFGMSSSGPLYLAFALTVIAVRLAGGRLADRYGRVAVAAPGLLACAAGLALLAAVPRPVAGIVGVSAYGAGFALLFPALMALAADRAPDSERGAVLGSFTAFFDVGASIGGYVIGAVADARGYGGAFALAMALCLLGCAGLVRIGRGPADGRPPRASEATLPDPAGA